MNPSPSKPTAINAIISTAIAHNPKLGGRNNRTGGSEAITRVLNRLLRPLS